MSEFKGIKKHHDRQINKLKKGNPIMYQMHPEDVQWLINRVEELEEEIERYWKSCDQLEDIIIRYKQALEEIAQDTGTPYADIAIKALAGDTE